jgi:hypothetical protein
MPNKSAGGELLGLPRKLAIFTFWPKDATPTPKVAKENPKIAKNNLKAARKFSKAARAAHARAVAVLYVGKQLREQV